MSNLSSSIEEARGWRAATPVGGYIHPDTAPDSSYMSSWLVGVTVRTLLGDCFA